MAKREKYKLRKFDWSPFWYVCWSEERKPLRISTGKEDQAEAERWKAEFVLEIDREQRTGEEFLVSDALHFYMENYSPDTPSHKTNGYNMVPLLEFFGDMTAMNIKQTDTRGFIKQQEGRGKAPGTIKRQLSLLSAAINFSHKENKIEFAPKIIMPKEPPPRDRWLTKEEAGRLISACTEEHVRLFIHIALFTGQRRGAILDLKWAQVNFDTRQIDFNPPGRIQTKKRRVPINMNDEFLPVMQAAYWRREQALDDGKRWAMSDYVVTYRGRGKDGKLEDIGKGFDKACADAGLNDVTPHTLKHTCGTWMAHAGAPMWQISGVLGHSLARTSELYLHHHPDYLKEATGAITLANNLQTNSGKQGQNKPMLASNG